MNRIVLFRGMCIKSGKWIYGDLIQWKSLGRCAIIPQEGDEWHSVPDFEVIPESVGQYTGVNDKNGRKIWEEDIFGAENRWFKPTVRYSNEASACVISNLVPNPLLVKYLENNPEYVVIGNTIENPELINKGE